MIVEELARGFLRATGARLAWALWRTLGRLLPLALGGGSLWLWLHR